MPSVTVVTPVLGGAPWAEIRPVLDRALRELGYASMPGAEEAPGGSRVELDVKQSRDLSESADEGRLVVHFGKIAIGLCKAPGERLRAHAAGDGVPEDALAAAGREAVGACLQAWARETIAGELKRRGFRVSEESMADGTIRLAAGREGG